MSNRIVHVPIEALNTEVFVRCSLNQDHALMLAELIANGVELPPILVTADLVVIDGRHRIEAHQLNDLTEIKAEIIEIKDEKELIALAFKANMGGALPPSPRDMEHTVSLLFERGLPKSKIGTMLGLPAGMARNLVNSVQTKMDRAKMNQVINEIMEGNITAKKAAEKYNVDLDKIKQSMGKNRAQTKQGMAAIKRQLTTRYKSSAQRNKSMLQNLLDSFQDGDISEQQVKNVFAHLARLQRAQARAVAGWQKRFESSPCHSKQAKSE